MKKAAYRLAFALLFGLNGITAVFAQERVAPPPPVPQVTATATGDAEIPHFTVVPSPNGDPMVVGGTHEAIGRTELVGLWRVVHIEQNGTADPLLAGQLHMRFFPGKVVLMQAGRAPIELAYELETRHEPRHFSWFCRPCGWIVMQRGVYWLTPDKLLLCLGSINERRATEFRTEPGDGRTMFILERANPGS